MCSVGDGGVAFELQLGWNVVVKDPILASHGLSWPHILFQALNGVDHLVIDRVDGRLIFHH